MKSKIQIKSKERWNGFSQINVKENAILYLPGVTILLSLSVFSLMIADALPQTSEAIPLLGQQPFNDKLDLNALFTLCF